MGKKNCIVAQSGGPTVCDQRQLSRCCQRGKGLSGF